MATLFNVQSELRARVQRMLDLDSSFYVNSAFRSRAEQEALYRKYQAAVIKYGAKNAPKYAAVAAKPGNSKHERNPADAVDLACPSTKSARRAELARQCGLHTPIAGEAWHMELAPNRQPLPAGLKTMEVKTMDVPTGVDAALIPGWRAPDGRPGVWVLKDDGGVFTYPDGAPFHGSMGGKTLNAPMTGIVAYSVEGYWTIGQDGGIFAFGAAPPVEPYKEFGNEYRVGAHRMVDGEFDGEFLICLSDDGGFYAYRVK